MFFMPIASIAFVYVQLGAETFTSPSIKILPFLSGYYRLGSTI